MKKITLFILGFIAYSFAINAQTPNYALAERFSETNIANSVFSTTVTPGWYKNSDKFWYSYKTTKGTQYYIVDPVAKTKTPIFDMTRLAMQLTEIVKDPFDAQHIPIQGFTMTEDNIFTFSIQSTVKENNRNKVFKFEYNATTGKLTDITDQKAPVRVPSWANISPDKTKAVFSKGYNLYWMSFEDVQKLMVNKDDKTVVEHQLTTDGIKDFGFGGRGDANTRTSANGVWSPDSKHFVTTISDSREIKDLWVIHSTAMPRPTLETYKYQMPGEPSPQVYMYFFDMTTGERKSVDIAAYKDQSVSVMSNPRKNADRFNEINFRTWVGDNNTFYIRRTSRDFKRVDICAVNVADLKVTNVIEERLNTYVDAGSWQLLDNKTEMLQWSERNGWANIYLYGTDGTIKKNINDADYHVNSILSVDQKNRVLYFSATGVDKEENPYYAHIYKIPFTGGTPKRLDEPNHHSSAVSFSDNGKFFVNNYSRVDCTPKSTLYDNNGNKIMDLEEADLSLLFAAGYQFPEQFKVKAADGVTDLWGVMYKPMDFDSTKVYPIIDYVYPGPQQEGNQIAWSMEKTHRLDRLAQVGFIVVTVGHRGGHPNRSKWYHNYGYGDLRDYGLEDQKYAIQQLAAKHKFIDIERVGIHGHSGGGFMSTAAMLVYPDFFKVAVSCAGNHDNSIYNRAWSERHHGIDEVITPDGDTTFRYAIDVNQELAKNLKGHLMFVIGEVDNNVHPAATMRVVDALIKANKRFDLLVMTGKQHHFDGMIDYFFWRMADFFSEWLLGDSQRDQVDITGLNNSGSR